MLCIAVIAPAERRLQQLLLLMRRNCDLQPAETRPCAGHEHALCNALRNSYGLQTYVSVSRSDQYYVDMSFLCLVAKHNVPYGVWHALQLYMQGPGPLGQKGPLGQAVTGATLAVCAFSALAAALVAQPHLVHAACHHLPDQLRSW